MTPDQAARFPLSWPGGWIRTASPRRRRAPFRKGGRPLSMWDAVARLSAELQRLGAAGEVLSTNVETRLDGLPRSGQGEPRDPGAAVYFYLKKQPRCLACDRWDKVADNVAAIAQHIDALRRIDRYGVGTTEQAFAGYAALAPDPTVDWRIVLGVNGVASRASVEEHYRTLARGAHPDLPGGSHDAMTRLNAARAAALRELEPSS